MQNLKPSFHAYLTENVLKQLFQNRIKTIMDFLQEDAERLATITKLNLEEVLCIKSDIIQKIAAPIENGATFLLRNKLHRKLIKTGIDSLDTILDGGIPVGCLTEICGLADCGKSQLCFQVAINCVKDSLDSVLYVDTKGDFSAVRLQKVLDALNFTHKEMALIMYKIRIVYAWTMDEIIDLFKKLKNKEIVINNLSLIIIDSLPCLMFQHLGDDSKVGLSLLNILVNYCRFLSKQMNLGLICINIQTRWMEQDASDGDEDMELSKTVTKESTVIEKRNRCLGRYWQHIPNIVILLEKVAFNEIRTELKVTLLKSLTYSNKNKTIFLNISNLGVTQ